MNGRDRCSSQRPDLGVQYATGRSSTVSTSDTVYDGSIRHQSCKQEHNIMKEVSSSSSINVTLEFNATTFPFHFGRSIHYPVAQT